MNYEKVKDCIVVVPSKARKYVDDIELCDKAKKCFSVASDKIFAVDELLNDETVADKIFCALGSFFIGTVIGLITTKHAKRLGYAILALSGMGLVYFAYKKHIDK